MERCESPPTFGGRCTPPRCVAGTPNIWSWGASHTPRCCAPPLLAGRAHRRPRCDGGLSPRSICRRAPPHDARAGSVMSGAKSRPGKIREEAAHPPRGALFRLQWRHWGAIENHISGRARISSQNTQVKRATAPQPREQMRPIRRPRAGACDPLRVVRFRSSAFGRDAAALEFRKLFLRGR